jgi:hypothetical protein
MPGLRIYLLGTPSVEWENHPLDIPRCQARALLYETSYVVDQNIACEKRKELNPPTDKEQLKQLREQSRKLDRLASMLTPMSKYYCSEMSNRVAYDCSNN